ncbi:MAG: HPr family phosphocarrier protein [Lachnospiraceae bacterium]|jgi:phosphotransferase system HPr (HPr) family protein|nr:HPr family phosphocarrier protein [Lachnospiraceae bacterium]
MKQKVAKVLLQNGLEARPVAMLVQVANRYKSSVYLETEDRKVNAKSIMGMMSIGLPNCKEITVITQGEDEQEAIDAIEQFLSKGE